MARSKRSSQSVEIAFPFRVVVPVASYRRFPDPVHPSLHHHTGYIPALLYPATGFPNSANIRPANIDRQIYKQIAESLRNVDCTPNLYHLKSKGELHVASQIRELGTEEARAWFNEHVRPFIPDDAAFAEFEKKYKLIEVLYEEGCSIVDGGHTDRIWSDPENQQAIRSTYTGEEDGAKNHNHLGVEWLVGVQDQWLPEIVGGRNTGLQVQEKTLANHQGKFDWLKDLLGKESYGALIAYRENEDRKSKPVDIRDVIAMIAPFNRDIYTLQDEEGKKQPLAAFSSKAAVLDEYIADQEEDGRKTFSKLARIIPDILQLHDLINVEAVTLYNKKTGGKGGKLDFVDHRDLKKQKPHNFYFMDDTGPDKLADGALYPILAAFSALVTDDADGEFGWALPNGFAGVKRVWQEMAPGFMEATKMLNQQFGYNPAQVGKNANHWKFLYLQLAFKNRPEK